MSLFEVYAGIQSVAVHARSVALSRVLVLVFVVAIVMLGSWAVGSVGYGLRQYLDHKRSGSADSMKKATSKSREMMGWSFAILFIVALFGPFFYTLITMTDYPMDTELSACVASTSGGSVDRDVLLDAGRTCLEARWADEELDRCSAGLAADEGVWFAAGMQSERQVTEATRLYGLTSGCQVPKSVDDQ